MKKPLGNWLKSSLSMYDVSKVYPEVNNSGVPSGFSGSLNPKGP